MRINFMVIIRNIINYFENVNASFLQIFFTFCFAITLRHFIELFSDHADFVSQLYVHYFFGYAALALSLILLFWFFTKEKIDKIAKIILPGFLILILAPSLDLLLSVGKGFDIRYMLLNIHHNLGLRYLTFCG